MSHNVCQNCWGENYADAENCRDCGQPLHRARVGATGDTPDEGGDNHSSRWVLITIILALALGSVLYRLLVWSRLEQTSALFIGLPAILAVLVALTPRAKTSTGMIMKVMTLALLMSGILLGEGFICIVMAAPLFYLVGFIVGIIMDSAKRRDAENQSRRTYGLLALPLVLLFSLEGVHRNLSFPRAEVVNVSRTVEADAAGVERALGEEPRFEKTLPLYLRLGFPKPVATEGQGLRVGDRRTVRFAGGEGKPGELVLEVAEAQAGRVLFRVLSDTSHISHWLDWKEAEVNWTPRADGQTDVRWTLRYDRRLDPAWYFAPWERYAVRLAAGYLIETLATPDGPTGEQHAMKNESSQSGSYEPAQQYGR
jgi:hypothetical protein